MKIKKINRKQLIHTFIFALFCVFDLTVAYAALSNTLNINGSAQVNSSEWSLTVTEDDISSWGNSIFSSIGKVINGNAVTFGNGAVIKKPTISGTTLNGFEFSLTKPGDEVALYYKITNTGTIPDVFKTYSFSEPTIISSVDNNNDVIWGQDNVLLEFDIEAPNDKGQMFPILTEYVVCPGNM